MSRTRRNLTSPQRIFDRCGPTKKARYRSQAAAEQALTNIERERAEGEQRRREQRVYDCEFCGGWHLTSKAR